MAHQIPVLVVGPSSIGNYKISLPKIRPQNPTLRF
jgi:hypothetical protein